MKKTIILLFFMLSIAFNSCKKEATAPARDKFIGIWTGVSTTIVTSNNVVIQNSTDVETENITRGNSESKIHLNEGTAWQLDADVWGDTFNVSEQNKSITGKDGSNIPVIVTGSGIVENSEVLKIQYTFKGTYQNIAFRYDISETLNKN